ncbi:DNA-binding MarR family transcriptional regulator [Deinococcus metalli]|uniref:DNA-binding MarR family transcriptional regulator n=1 Tax=Deinococcus metalli TaxID=1141878 RepID=A0A7W8KJH8_9DEIO|nr:MarR family winged helix-turn-helix transcriptional regulator [Deinococcus metalli]MBB5378106.1 DNA-binding MarR family transcriptional regulator [Deinococcus metalli]
MTDLAGQLYATGMAAIGLQPPHVAILQILADEGPMNQNRLAARTRIDKAPLVGHLNVLETSGLVERRPHPTDRRAFEVHLTLTGRDKLAQAERVNADVTDRFFAPLAPDERRTLHALLTRLASSHPPHSGADHDPDRPTDP